MKLRTIAMSVVAALALVAGTAQAQEAGWDTKYGILFTVPNLFNGHAAGDTSLINDYNGLVGFQYNLGPQTALRFGADISRTSTGITETTNGLPGGVTTKSVPLVTSSYGITLDAEYLMRMGQAAVAPYFGAGAFLSYGMVFRDGQAEVPGTVTKYDWKDTNGAFGVLAKAGLEWRVHKVISFFAEYEADLTLVAGTSTNHKTTANGTPTLDSKSDEAHYFNFGTGLAHGGKLGLVAYF